MRAWGLIVVALVMSAGAACRTVPPPATSSVTNPSAAFLAYWEERLRLEPGASTWRDFCSSLERWPVLGRSDVARLDEALADWPAELRVVPDGWRALTKPVGLPAWPLVRSVNLGPDDVDALAGSLPHLDSVTHARIVSSTTLHAVAETPALPHLAAVAAEGIDIASLRALSERRGGSLEELDLWENGLGEELADVLTSRTWPVLRKLDVGANRLGIVGATAIGALDAPTLIDLRISFNMLGDDGLRAALGTQRTLVSLDARAVGAAEAIPEALTTVGTASLETLDLSDNTMADTGIERLARLALPRLRELRLNATAMTAIGATALAGVLQGGLEVLELGRNELTDSGVEPLCVPGLSGVRFLNLDAVRLTNAGAAGLAACKHLGRLASLSLHNNGDIDAGGITALASTPFAHLRAVGLDGCVIGNAGLVALSKASWWPRLTHLRIEGNQLTDDAIRAVFHDAPAGLRNLGLGWNELGGGSADALAASPLLHLQVLSLRGNALDAAAVMRLAEAPWLGRLEDFDLRSLAFDGLDLGLDAIAARMRGGATLRREK